MSDAAQWRSLSGGLAGGLAGAFAALDEEEDWASPAPLTPSAPQAGPASAGVTALFAQNRKAGFSQNPLIAAAHANGSGHASGTPQTGTDPLQTAYDRGFAEGMAAASAEAAEREALLAQATRAIELRFAQWDASSAAALKERLRVTVMALCEEAVMPLALDEDGLLHRIEKAAALLQRATDERLVLLNPADFERICHRLPQGLAAQPNPSVEPGGLRIETPDGGVEDGPSQWRLALAEAFRSC